jgi:hypothetical protein
MTRYEIAVLACKILALWVLVQIAFLLENMLYMVLYLIETLVGSSDPNRTYLLSNASLAILGVGMAVIALCFWFQAPRLAKWMVSQDATPVTAGQVTKDDVMMVAFSTAGAFLLIQGLERIARTVLAASWGKEPFRYYWSDGLWQAGFWATVVHITAAAWLMLGSRGIVQFVSWLRTAGVHSESTSHQPSENSSSPPSDDANRMEPN